MIVKNVQTRKTIWCLVMFIIDNFVNGHGSFGKFMELQTAEQQLVASLGNFQNAIHHLQQKLPSFMHKQKQSNKKWYSMYGSINERHGASTARFFQPNKRFFKNINRHTDIDLAHCYEFSKKQQYTNIEELSGRLGYVRLKLDDQLLKRIFKQNIKYKRWKKLPNKKSQLKMLSTDNKYINIAKLKNMTCKDTLFNSTEHIAEMVISVALDSKHNEIVSIKEKKEISVAINGRPFWKLGFKRNVMIKLNWWPKVAENWRKRSRIWPKQNVINQLTKVSFLYAKLSNLKNGTNEMKYSFIKVEGLLTGMRTLAQHLNFFIFKSIFYRWLKPIAKEKLTSYIVKTIMFWTCEMFLPTNPIWDIQNNNNNNKNALFNHITNYPYGNISSNNHNNKYPVICHMLQTLLKSFEKNYLQNYFIPEINVLNKQLSKKTRQKIIQRLKAILQNIEDYIPNNTIQVKRSVNELVTFIDKLSSFANQTVHNGVFSTMLQYPNITKEIIKYNLGQELKAKRKSLKKYNVYWKLLIVFCISMIVCYVLQRVFL